MSDGTIIARSGSFAIGTEGSASALLGKDIARLSRRGFMPPPTASGRSAVALIAAKIFTWTVWTFITPPPGRGGPRSRNA